MKTFFTADIHFGCEKLVAHIRQMYSTIEEHANKIAGDRVAALKAGSVFIESCSSRQKHYWRVNGTNIEWVHSEDIEA